MSAYITYVPIFTDKTNTIARRKRGHVDQCRRWIATAGDSYGSLRVVIRYRFAIR